MWLHGTTARLVDELTELLEASAAGRVSGITADPSGVESLLAALCLHLTGRPLREDEARQVHQGGLAAFQALLRTYQQEPLLCLEWTLTRRPA